MEDMDTNREMYWTHEPEYAVSVGQFGEEETIVPMDALSEADHSRDELARAGHANATGWEKVR